MVLRRDGWHRTGPDRTGPDDHKGPGRAGWMRKGKQINLRAFPFPQSIPLIPLAGCFAGPGWCWRPGGPAPGQIRAGNLKLDRPID